MFIAGEPATMLSSRDRAWREVVANAGVSRTTSVRLRFVVSSWLRGWNSFDLDNLVDPVLAKVEGDADLQTLWATVELGDVPGVYIEDGVAPPPPCEAVQIHLGDPPRRSKRTDQMLAELAGAKILGTDEAIGCSLVLGADTGGIVFGFEGAIKPTIDGLWPVLGGAAHSPADHRIRELRVSKDPSLLGVDLALWLVPAGESDSG